MNQGTKKKCGHGYLWSECEVCGKHPESWGKNSTQESETL